MPRSGTISGQSVEANEQGGDHLAMARARRRIILAVMATFALLLAISLVTALATPAASAAEPGLRNLVIRSVTIDPQTKVATAKGAVTCTRGDFLSVDVDVRQTVGRLHTVRASAFKELACDGRVSFTLRLRNDEGRLGPGDARVDAGAFSCRQDDCSGIAVNRAVRITNAH
jgi:hypothetical protein